jgi:probable F420-dependent oxidoreductase
MKIGIGVYNSIWLPDIEGISHAEVFQNDLAQAQLAEKVGLDSIWCTEHHFLKSANNPSPLTLCAAMAAVTNRIELGPAVMLGPLYHPIRVAEECAVVDLISQGRLRVGIGLGYRDEEYRGIGVERKRRGLITDELIQVMKQAWSDHPVDFHGKVFDFADIDVQPKPYQTGGPPIWTGGGGDPALQRSARLADGFIMDAGTDSKSFTGTGYNRAIFTRIAEMVSRYRAALAEQGRKYEDVTFALTIGGFLSERSADDAWEAVQEAYMSTRRVYAEWYNLPPEEYVNWYPKLMTQEEHEARRAELWLGTPDELLPLVRELERLCGDHLHLQFRTKYPGVPHDRMCDSIRLLGDLRRMVSH